MNIYILAINEDLIGKLDLYYFDSHIIAAKSSTTARTVANSGPALEGNIWEDGQKVYCTKVGNYTGGEREPHIILSSFNAG